MPAKRHRSEATCAVLAGAIAAVLLAGCGGSGDGHAAEISLKPVPTLHTSPLAKPAFLKQATALCVRVREESMADYRDYFRRHGVKLTARNLRSSAAANAAGLYATVVIPTYRREVEGISALGAPRGDTQRVTAILNAIEQGIETGEREPLSYFFKGTVGKNPLHPAYLLAAAYGLGPCAL